MDMKTMSKTVEKFTLREPVTLEDLYALMTQRWTAQLPGNFKLKKGLFGKSIQFDVYMNMQPKVTVKDNVVTVRRWESSTQVNGIDFKAATQRIDALGSGGLKKAAFGGLEYFIGVCDAMRELLSDKII